MLVCSLSKYECYKYDIYLTNYYSYLKIIYNIYILCKSILKPYPTLNSLLFEKPAVRQLDKFT